MTIQIEINSDVEEQLVAGAKALGIPVEKYAERLLADAMAFNSKAEGKLSVYELHAMLDAIAEGSSNLPKLPTEVFTRESFYKGRC